jgi:mannitol-1-phosphate/altronate dehydrogenase
LGEAIEQGLPHGNLTFAVAAWFRYLRGVDFDGEPIEVRDAMSETLQPLALEGMHDPRPLLGVSSVFGDLGRDEDFVAELAEALEALDRLGPTAALQARLGGRLALAA